MRGVPPTQFGGFEFLNGFYDRRVTTGAPTSAFVTSEKIEKLMLLTDVTALTGRVICYGNLYLDGVRVLNTIRAPKGARNLRKDPIDQLVDPGAVLAISRMVSRVGRAAGSTTRLALATLVAPL